MKRFIHFTIAPDDLPSFQAWARLTKIEVYKDIYSEATNGWWLRERIFAEDENRSRVLKRSGTPDEKPYRQIEVIDQEDEIKEKIKNGRAVYRTSIGFIRYKFAAPPPLDDLYIDVMRHGNDRYILVGKLWITAGASIDFMDDDDTFGHIMIQPCQSKLSYAMNHENEIYTYSSDPFK